MPNLKIRFKIRAYKKGWWQVNMYSATEFRRNGRPKILEKELYPTWAEAIHRVTRTIDWCAKPENLCN
jgi:hypothetical protein